MTIANDIIFLSLRNAGIVGVGQSPLADDVNDSFTLLNALIGMWNLERAVQINQIQLQFFPDLTSDVPFWDPYTHVLLTSLSVRLRQVYALPPVEIDVQMAANAVKLLQTINQQQIAPIHGGVPETAQQVIFLALRMAGRLNDAQSVGDASKEVDDAFSLLVMMLGQWQRKRWLVWNEEEVSCVANGNYSYTIGPGGDFDVARPDKIHAAFVRLTPGAIGGGGTSAGSPLAAMLPFPLGGGSSSGGTGTGTNPVDIPLSIIESKEDWATIAVKDLQSIPAGVFYDSSYPIGQVYFWPVPPAGIYEMHLMVKAQLPVPTTVTDQLMLPPEYLDAVVNNLACRIIVASGGQISPFLLAQASASLNTIKLANSQIPLLSMPAALSGHRSDMSSWAGRGLNQAWIVGGTSVLL